MSAGRRGLLLSVAFLGLALWVCRGERAQAQPMRPQPGGWQPPMQADPNVGRHTIWQQYLTPDQIRKALGNYSHGENGTNDLLRQLIREEVKKKNPNIDDTKLDAAIDRILGDKELMNRLMDMAQKQKNQSPPGHQPRLTPEDLAKIAKLRPDAPNGDPFKVPKFDPNDLPKWDFKKFGINPDNPPRIDPGSGFPLDENTGLPFNPATGERIDPRNPPRIDPKHLLPPKDDPGKSPHVGPRNPRPDPMNPAPPKIDPRTGQPLPPEPDPKRPFDPENPLGTPKQTPEQAAKTKAVEAATALWEKNVGPIEESPAVQRAIIDLVSDADAMDALTDGKGNSIFDILNNETGDGEKLGDWLKGGDSKWEWPKLDWGPLNWGKRDRDIDFGPKNSDRGRWPNMPDRAPRTGSSGLNSLGSFNFGGAQIPWLLVLLVLAAIAVAVVLWKWKDIFTPRSDVSFAADGLGAWPIDPREINTREDVVKAFEYLSVLICGPAAKTWTHSTIADELSALAATHGETAVKLARLYELARYAPLDEPLTRAELLEARRLVCDLAGVDEA
jgi:hypothetical protein